jgi:hypothetical protein
VVVVVVVVVVVGGTVVEDPMPRSTRVQAVVAARISDAAAAPTTGAAELNRARFRNGRFVNTIRKG